MKKNLRYLTKIKSFFSVKTLWKTGVLPHNNKHFLVIVLCAGIFFVSFVGQMIAVVGSRQVIEPVTIEVKSASGQEISSFKRYMQLARSGNYSFIRPQTNGDTPWLVNGVFIKKLLVGMDKNDFSQLKSIHVRIGEKNFEFNDVSAITQWAVFDKSSIKAELKISREEYDNFVVLEIPGEVGLSRSKIPVYKDFFGSIINWGGDHIIFENPFKKALLSTGIFLLFWILVVCIFSVTKERVLLKKDTGDILLSQKKFVTFFIVFMTTLGLIFLLNVAVYAVYKPDIAHLLLTSSHEYTSYFYKHFRPKPVERLQFIMSLLSSPFILWAVYSWYSKKLRISDQFVNRWHGVFVVATLLFIYSVVYLGLAMSGFFYLQDSFFYGSNVRKCLYFLLFFPIGLLVFMLREKLSKTMWVLLYSTILFVVFVVFSMQAANASYLINSLTLDPVLYPLSQTVMGKSLLVNLDSYYGLFPLFLAPLFHLIDLSVLSFSVCMAVLMVLSVACVFFSMRRMVQNNILLFFGFLTTIFYSLLATRTVPDYYFQYWPIRYVFPCISLLLVTLFLKNKNKFLYYFSFIFYAIGVFWNVDVGVVVFLSWLIILIYREIASFNSWRRIIINIAKHMAVGIIIFAAVVGSFVLVTFLQSQKIPDFSRLVQYQKIFLSGYLMVKMIPPPHMWFVVVLMYLTGLLTAVRAFVEKKVGYREEVILFLSILGLGLFSYYEGQSTDVTLFRTSYPALILLVIFADSLWQKIKGGGFQMYGESVLFVCALCVILTAPFNLLFNGHTYNKFIKTGISAFKNKESVYTKNIHFIKQNTEEGEGIFILSYPNQGIYYAESKTRSAIDVTSIADIPYPEEIERLVTFLEKNREVKIFAEYPLEKYDEFDSRIKKIVETKYKEVEKSGYGISLFQPI